MPADKDSGDSPRPPRPPRSPPPPPPVYVPDPAYCSLVDPAATLLESCLIDTIRLTTKIRNPVCPTAVSEIPIGDLAFSILSDRRPELWASALPDQIASGTAQEFHQWLGEASNREQLFERVQTELGR